VAPRRRRLRNANLSSKAGISAGAVDARRWLVMGDMGELGDYAVESHGDIGRSPATTASTGCSPPASCRARGGGFWLGRRVVSDTETLARAVSPAHARSVRARQGLGSNRLERVVEALVGTPAQDGNYGMH
jgi:UDP-N-acetylmuramyl pentapeptide synthase